MKRLFVLAIASIALLSCTEPNENSGNILVESTFYDMFPSASDLEWDIEAGYYVADFKIGRDEVAAWFTSDGEWKMTEYEITESDLPDAVEDAFDDSGYGDWKVEDVEKIVRHDQETIYIIDARDTILDLDRANEVELKYYASGEQFSEPIVNGIDDDNYYLLSY